MANPQKENGFIPIANELQEQFIRFSFSKRQHTLLNLILRLSYGCKRKNAYIPKFSYFYITGIDKSDIRKELEQLEAAQVLTWHRSSCLFAINKDYEKWTIKRNNKFDQNLFSDLLAMQLNPDFKIIKRVGKTPTFHNEEVSKTPTTIEGSRYFTNSKVSKTPTQELVKHQLTPPANDWESKRQATPKDIIKDNIKDKNNITITPPGLDLKDSEPDITPQQEIIGEVFTFFDENIKRLTPHYTERVNDWLEDHPADLVLYVFKYSLDVTTSSGGTPLILIDKIFKRMRETGIETISQFEQAEQQREAEKQKAPGKRITRNEVIPEWYDQQKQKPQEQPQDMDQEEIDRAREALKKEIQAMTRAK